MPTQPRIMFQPPTAGRVQTMSLNPTGEGVIFVRSAHPNPQALLQQAETVAAAVEQAGMTAAVLLAANGIAGTGRAGDDHRADLRELLKLAQQPHIKWVAVARPDRLSRDFDDAQATRASLAEFGVAVHHADTGRALSKLTAARSRARADAGCNNVVRPRPVPRGFRYDENGRLVLDEAQFDSVVTLYDLRTRKGGTDHA